MRPKYEKHFVNVIIVFGFIFVHVLVHALKQNTIRALKALQLRVKGVFIPHYLFDYTTT